MFDVFDLQKRLVAAAAPSGSERGCAQVIQQLAKPLCDEVYTDELGNLICHKKGSGKKVMLTAHMDVIGFMATFIDDRGFVWFDAIGGHFPAYLINTRVVFQNGVCGVIRPRELSKLVDKKLPFIRMDDLFIDIGAKDQKEAERLVKIGDTAVFEGAPQKIGGGRVMGPYADDLVCCTLLLLCMEQVKSSHSDLYFVFSTQEEVGCRGSGVAAFGIDPDLGLACDVCSTGDTPGEDNTHMAVCVGKGPTIKIKDRSVICSPALNQKLRSTAKKAGIPYQDEILVAGGTDTSSIQSTRAGVAASCISVPTRNIHTPVEIFSIEDVRQGAALMAAFLQEKL